MEKPKTCMDCKWVTEGSTHGVLCQCELAYYFRRGHLLDTVGIVPMNNASQCPAFAPKDDDDGH